MIQFFIRVELLEYFIKRSCGTKLSLDVEHSSAGTITDGTNYLSWNNYLRVVNCSYNIIKCLPDASLLMN